jgi:hypothetical protein
VCDRWLANLYVEVKTEHEYAGYVRRTIRPALGAVPLPRLDALAIEGLYAQLRLCRLGSRWSTTARLATISAKGVATAPVPAAGREYANVALPS